MSSSVDLPWLYLPSAASTYETAVPTPTSPAGTVAGQLDTTATASPSAFPSWWSGIGGPAIIIVFTAVGLLGMCIAMLLILRALRLRRLDGFYNDEDDGGLLGPLTVSRLRKRRFGEPPKIYDLSIAYYKGGDGKENVAKWGGIVPLSATYMKEKADLPIDPNAEKQGLDSNISRVSTTSSYPGPSYPTPEPLAHGIGAFNWRYLHPSPQLRDASISTHEAKAPPLPEARPDRMQVAVAIAMPRPPLPSVQRTTPRSPPGLTAEPMPELCLGFTQVKGVDVDEWAGLHANS